MQNTRLPEPLVDIHCHVLPALDDGAVDESTALAMARMAGEDGIATIVATPHQLGRYRANTSDTIRRRATAMQDLLDRHAVAIRVLPGADVRIEERLVDHLQRDEVLTLADRRKHLLLELPHEIYLPLEPLIDQLLGVGVVGILSHPERNRGILRCPDIVDPLVDAGCLVQVTAGSLTGGFGGTVRRLSERLLDRGLIHFVSSDAHDLRRRPPLLRQAWACIAERTDPQTALDLCCRNPQRVADGSDVAPGRRQVRKRSRWRSIADRFRRDSVRHKST